ncbi:MAG TPA: GGDEF domain-containing protein [Pseudonocardiaceae bacterium]
MHPAVPLPRSGTGRCPVVLRERWRRATLAAGWVFPDDWEVPEVDAVCRAVAGGRDPAAVLRLLGRARAGSGAGLEEVLRDLAALHSVLGAAGDRGAAGQGAGGQGRAAAGAASPDVDGVPARHLRLVALGWADVTSGEVVQARVVDQLTGLTTLGYLRTRLSEVYRCAAAHGRPAGERHALVLLRLDRSRTRGWTRLIPMLLAAEAMRAVFGGGETLALVGPSVAAVLCARDDGLPLRAHRLRRTVTELLVADPDVAASGPVRVRSEPLPATLGAACALLAAAGR